MTTIKANPLDVWLRIPEGEEEAEAEANTYRHDDYGYRVEWYLTAVGLVKSVWFRTLAEAHSWLETEGFENYSVDQYVPTHRSIQDGSDAMQVTIAGIPFALSNEDGDQWEADPAEWRAVDPDDPYAFMEGINYQNDEED